MDDFVTRIEHTEFAKRIEAEEHRQNKRLDLLETTVKDFQRVALGVEKLSIGLENMVKAQENMNKRLGELEREPADKWKILVSGIIGALATAIGAAILGGFLR